MTVEIFEVNALVYIFRSSLLALLPVMDAAKIRWMEPGDYDPWENITMTLYASIIGGCVDNNAQGTLPHLAAYSIRLTDYRSVSFLSESGLFLDGKVNALLEFQTTEAPFDTVSLLELDSTLSPISLPIAKPIEACHFNLAVPAGNDLLFQPSIVYCS